MAAQNTSTTSNQLQDDTGKVWTQYTPGLYAAATAVLNSREYEARQRAADAYRQAHHSAKVVRP